MIDRNADIARNKVEILERRKAELLRDIAEHEARLTDLSGEFDRAVKADRLRAIFSPPAPQGGPADDQRREREDRIEKQELRTSFAIGLSISLVVGLLLVLVP